MNKDSAFVDFFTVVAAPPIGHGDALLLLQEIREILQRDELTELEGVRDFLRISRIEGEGSYFYNRKTDAVYDAQWGQEASMVAGELEPMSPSFAEFLEWYYGN